MRTFSIKETPYLELYDFLESHEADIAAEIEDFSNLEGLFKVIIGRTPKDSPVTAEKLEVNLDE